MRLRLLLTLALLASAACTDNAPEAPVAEDLPAAAAEAPPTSPAEPQAIQPQDTQAIPAPAPTAEAPAPIEATQADARLAAVSARGFELGVHFERLSPTQPTSSSPDQVEVAEFFMYSCVHCYNFEPYVQQWLTQKPAYINFIRVPTVWNPPVRLHGQAFYAAEALGKGEEMHASFFREMHVDGNFMQTEDSIAEFFGRFGVDDATFRRTFSSFAVHTKVERADELTRRYRVEGTPTVVVNGKYVTTATAAGGFDKLIELIDALAESERPLN